MKTLTLEHLKYYLDCELQFITPKHRFKYGEEKILTARGMSLCDDGSLNIEFLHENDLVFSNEMKFCKPILRSLSTLDWKNFIDENHRKMSDAIHDFIEAFENDKANQHTLFESAPLIVANYAFKNHYDVFNLIQDGLAVDIKTINQ